MYGFITIFILMVRKEILFIRFAGFRCVKFTRAGGTKVIESTNGVPPRDTKSEKKSSIQRIKPGYTKLLSLEIRYPPILLSLYYQLELLYQVVNNNGLGTRARVWIAGCLW